ncbi:MAG: hypothetical protein GEU91_21125 [Rhizobiales bacterium]|nr:hypothetical protein [Hyphomicrobiales bacterium]
MAHRIQGLIFILLGIVALLDSWRITEEVRPTANFDGIGPDRYLAIVSVIMIVLGAALSMRAKIAGETSDWSDLRRWPPADFVLIAIVMAAFIWIIPVIGFVASCLLFFLAAFGILGDRPWWRTVGYAVVTTIAIYVIFIHLADLSLPKSFLGV